MGNADGRDAGALARKIQTGAACSLPSGYGPVSQVAKPCSHHHSTSRDHCHGLSATTATIIVRKKPPAWKPVRSPGDSYVISRLVPWDASERKRSELGHLNAFATRGCNVKFILAQQALVYSPARPHGRAIFIGGPMKRDTRYDAFETPVGDIFYDQPFNCRRPFTLESVASLAANIAENGLEMPLIVQPSKDCDASTDKPWRLVAGHRRYVAVTQKLGWSVVPCMIRRGLSKRQAELLNLTENLERNDLNPLEEALAIATLFPDEMSATRVGRSLKRPAAWVAIRFCILRMPEPIQQMIASGRLSLVDLEVLDQITDRGKLLATAEKIAGQRATQRGRRPRVKDSDTGDEIAGKTKRVRTRSEVMREVRKMLERGIVGLAPRFGAWFAGYISDADWQSDISKEFSRMREETTNKKAAICK